MSISRNGRSRAPWRSRDDWREAYSMQRTSYPIMTYEAERAAIAGERGGEIIIFERRAA